MTLFHQLNDQLIVSKSVVDISLLESTELIVHRHTLYYNLITIPLKPFSNTGRALYQISDQVTMATNMQVHNNNNYFCII